MKTYLRFSLHKGTEIPQDVIDALPKFGAADCIIGELRETVDVDVSLEDSREFLRSTGGWEDSELNNLDENKNRLLWIACLDCRENETTYFYMGA